MTETRSYHSAGDFFKALQGIPGNSLVATNLGDTPKFSRTPTSPQGQGAYGTSLSGLGLEGNSLAQGGSPGGATPSKEDDIDLIGKDWPELNAQLALEKEKARVKEERALVIKRRGK